MAWTYRKRIKIAPGVHLNISKKGFSTTFGVRGANITSGQNGTYLNTGIPGTGIYNRRKIADNKTSPQYRNNTQKRKRESGNAPWWFFLLLFTVGVWLYISFKFELDKSIVFTGIAAFAFLPLSIAIVNSILKDVMHAKKLKKQSQEFYTAQVESAKTAIYKEKDPVKKEILQNFLSCFELHQQTNETEAIIEALKNKIAKKSNPKLKEQLKIYETKLSELSEKLNTVQLDIDKDLDDTEKQQYAILCKSFEQLLSCKKTWIITPDAKQKIDLDTGVFNYIKSSFNTPIFQALRGVCYIYPRYIIKAQSPTHFEIFPIETITLTYSTQIFTEIDVPEDAQVTYCTYKYTNKDGTPDRRYSYNPRYSVVKYGKIEISQLGLTYCISNCYVAEKFVNIYNAYITKTLRNGAFGQTGNETSNEITESYFNTINDAAENIVAFYQDLKNNKSFQLAFTAIIKLLKPAGIGITDVTDQIRFLFLMDIIQCYIELGYPVDLKSKEGIGLTILFLRILNAIEPVTYSSFKIMSVVNIQQIEDYVKQIKDKGIDEKFTMSWILEKYDTDMQKKHLVLLYRFASIMAKADGTISETEQQWLSKLLKLSEGKTALTNEKKYDIHNEKSDTTKINPHAELQSLTGLSSVKTEILTLVNFLKIQKARQSKGLKTSQPSYHCVFTGNPGTGKTTVARIVAGIYKDLDILEKGHLIETDRSGLIAEYVGQTAVKTNKIIDSALDGVLFIDEAYSLSGGNNDYGKEAVATLLKRMEDDRNRLIVILAGYTSEMKEFINSNSGLQSRFNRYIDFPDYSAEELYQIFELNLKKFDYTISNEANAMLKEYFQKKVSEKDHNFGNARFVRNVFEKTLERQANRLAQETNITTEKLSEIIIDDIIMNVDKRLN